MKINLNNPASLTADTLSNLIASVDDAQDCQLRVTTEGELFISNDVGAENLEGILFRLEAFDEGNDYIGSKAASDATWINRLLAVIQENYPNPTSTYIDSF
jgi:hypothetical protein